MNSLLTHYSSPFLPSLFSLLLFVSVFIPPSPLRHPLVLYFPPQKSLSVLFHPLGPSTFSVFSLHLFLFFQSFFLDLHPLPSNSSVYPVSYMHFLVSLSSLIGLCALSPSVLPFPLYSLFISSTHFTFCSFTTLPSHSFIHPTSSTHSFSPSSPTRFWPILSRHSSSLITLLQAIIPAFIPPPFTYLSSFLLPCPSLLILFVSELRIFE